MAPGGPRSGGGAAGSGTGGEGFRVSRRVVHVGGPGEGPGGVVDRARARRPRPRAARRRLTDEPEIRAELLAILGTVYQRLGFFEDARELKVEALADRRAADSSERTELASDLNNLAGLHYRLGEYDAAEGRYTEALAIWRRLGEEQYVALALNNLTSVLIQQGRFEEALTTQAEALAIRERIFGPESVQMAASLYSLGALHRIRGDMERAEPLLRRALESYRRFDDRRAAVARVLNSLGQVLHARGRLADGRDHLEEALALRRRIFGENHVNVATSAKNLAAVLLDQEETAAAGSLLEGALATLRDSKPAGHWAILEAESVWGSYLAAAGRRDEAEPFLVRQSSRPARDPGRAPRGDRRGLATPRCLPRGSSRRENGSPRRGNGRAASLRGRLLERWLAYSVKPSPGAVENALPGMEQPLLHALDGARGQRLGAARRAGTGQARIRVVLFPARRSAPGWLRSDSDRGRSLPARRRSSAPWRGRGGGGEWSGTGC